MTTARDQLVRSAAFVLALVGCTHEPASPPAVLTIPSSPAEQVPPLTGMLGERPWTARRAYLVRLNEGARATTSTYPGQQFLIVESTIFVFDEDVACEDIPADLFPMRWRTGKRYLEIRFSGSWPLAEGTHLQSGARYDKPSDLRVSSAVQLGGSFNGQGFTGPLHVVSTRQGRTVLDLDLSSPNRFGPNYGDLRGQLEVTDCIKKRVWAKPPP
jgi:hypothetical protein